MLARVANPGTPKVKAAGNYLMSKSKSGYQANTGHDTITIKAASMVGPFKVNTPGRGYRPVSFPDFAAARAFVEGFDVGLISVQIGKWPRR
jgi:hypothetical protein